MSTSLVLGNGSLLVNLNQNLEISDLYWPHVGQEDHLAKLPNEIFFRIDGEYSYPDSDKWLVTPNYKNDTLVSSSEMVSDHYGIKITIEDAVLPDKDILIRYIHVENITDHDKEFMIFFKNNYYMLEDDLGNTAIWYPLANVMCHYKKARYVGIGSTNAIYQFTCAAPNDNHGRGAVPNSEGELHYNPVTTGSAQSCISYKFEIKAHHKIEFDQFTVCGSCYDQITELSSYVRNEGAKHLIDSTDKYWKNWVRSKVGNYFEHEFPNVFEDREQNTKLFREYKRSLLIIRTQFDNDGAIVAANDSSFLKSGGKDTYSYFWPRDGALISLALIEVGFGDLVKKFFRYCKQVVAKEGYVLHKYYPKLEHGLASSWHPWVDKGGNLQLPIQEDETSLVIYALWKHYERFGDQEFLNEMWDSFVKPAAEFLFSYRYSHSFETKNIANNVSGYQKYLRENPIDADYKNSGLPRPSYGIWEIERGIFTYTAATVYAGLDAAAKLAASHGDEKFRDKYQKAAEEVRHGITEHLFDIDSGIFIKSIKCDEAEHNCIKDKTLDSQLFALWALDVFDVEDPRIESTIRAIEEKLWVNTEVGGIARKENDWYHRDDDTLQGNPWFICTLWLAQYWIMKKDLEKAKKYLSWVLLHIDSTGLIAEQADPHTGYAKSVKPLTWSHAEFVKTVNLLKGMSLGSNT